VSVPSQLTYTAIERRVGAGLAIAVAAAVLAGVMTWVVRLVRLVRRHRRTRARSEG